MSGRRRLGRFVLQARIINPHLEAGIGSNLFEGMFVLRAEHSWHSDSIRYLAIHPDFRPVREGELVPLYVAHFTPDSPTPRWVEQKGEFYDEFN